MTAKTYEEMQAWILQWAINTTVRTILHARYASYVRALASMCVPNILYMHMYRYLRTRDLPLGAVQWAMGIMVAQLGGDCPA